MRQVNVVAQKDNYLHQQSFAFSDQITTAKKNTFLDVGTDEKLESSLS